MIAFLYYTEWYFIFPLYFKNYFQNRNGCYFLQAERLVSWYNKRKQGNTDSIVVRLGSCIFMQSEE